MNNFIITTVNYSTVWSICKESLSNSDFIGIIGYPGAGKTTAFKKFKKEHSNVYYVRATASMPAKEFYQAILIEMGVGGFHDIKSLYHTINLLSYHLNRTNTRKLIIIDEGGKIKPKFLEYIHELRDNTENTTGIVIAGPEYFKDNLDLWNNRKLDGIPELYRRIRYWEILDPPTKEEVIVFCHQNNIKDEKFIQDVYSESSNFGEIINKIDFHVKSSEKTSKK